MFKPPIAQSMMFFLVSAVFQTQIREYVADSCTDFMNRRVYIQKKCPILCWAGGATCIEKLINNHNKKSSCRYDSRPY